MGWLSKFVQQSKAQQQQGLRDKRPFDFISEALQYWKKGQHQIAEPKFKEGILAYYKKDPSDVHFALGRYGAFLMDQGRMAEAEAVVEEAIALGTDIRPTWGYYLQLLSLRGATDRLLEIYLQMPGSLEERTTAVLKEVKRAERRGELDFAEQISRAVVERNDTGELRTARWMAAGALGRVLSRKGASDAGIEIWLKAFDEGSDDPVTAEGLVRHYKNKKDFDSLTRIVEAALKRGLPADVENRLRKALLKAAPRGAKGGTTEEPLPFSTRYGEEFLTSEFLLRPRPQPAYAFLAGDSLRTVARTRDRTIVSVIGLPEGRIEKTLNLPAVAQLSISPSGHSLGLVRSAVHKSITLLFLDPEGTRIGEFILSGIGDFACGTDTWFVSDRDGDVFAFDRAGRIKWRWKTPQVGGGSLSPGQHAFAYFLEPMGDALVVGSWGDVYVLSPHGQLSWKSQVPERRYFFDTRGERNPQDLLVADRTWGRQDPLVLEKRARFEAAYRETLDALAPLDNCADSPGPMMPSGIEGSVTATSVEVLLPEGKITSVSGGSNGLVVGSEDGRVTLFDPRGKIRHIYELGGPWSFVKVSSTDGLPLTAWCQGKLHIFRGDAFVGDCDMSDAPTGVVRLSDQHIFVWRKRDMSIIDYSGATLWAAEFAHDLGSVHLVENVLVCCGGWVLGLSLAEQGEAEDDKAITGMDLAPSQKASEVGGG